MYTISHYVTPSSSPLLPPLPRLGELSAQKKHVVKDLKRNTAEANHVRKHKEKREQEEKLEQSRQVQTHRTSEEGRSSSNHNILSLVLKVQIHDS